MDIDLAGWRKHTHNGMMGALGPLLSRQIDEVWHYGLVARDVHLNGAGVVHGGSIAGLMDQALSALAWAHADRRPCLTIQMNVNFLDAIHPGEFMVASGRLTRKTKSLLFLDGNIYVNDRAVATAQAIFKIMKAGA